MSEHVKNGKRHIVACLGIPWHMRVTNPVQRHVLNRNAFGVRARARSPGDPTPVNTNCTPSRYHQLISPSNNYDTNLPVPQMISLSLLAVSQWISPSHNSPSSTVDLPSYHFHSRSPRLTITIQISQFYSWSSRLTSFTLQLVTIQNRARGVLRGTERWIRGW